MPFIEMNFQILIAVILVLVSSLTSGRIVKAPVDTVYPKGFQTTGYLECEVDLTLNMTLYWFVPKGNIYNNRYGFIGNNETKYSLSETATTNGNFTLAIHNLVREDTGTYTCQFGGETKNAKLIAQAEPYRIVTLAPKPSNLSENNTFEFNCSTKGGFPLPTITWYLGDRQLHTIETFTQDEFVRGLVTVTLSHLDHESKITCVAMNALKTHNASRQLNVQFSPKVRIVTPNIVVLRKIPSKLRCNVSSNPNYTTILWKDCCGRVIQNGSSVYSVGEGTTFDTTFTCEAVNSIGTGTDTAAVTVHYFPIITSAGPDVTLEKGKKAFLVCKVDAKPPASVYWRIGSKTLSESTTLASSTITVKDAGVYQCVANNTVFPSNGPAIGITTTVIERVSVRVLSFLNNSAVQNEQPIAAVGLILLSSTYQYWLLN